MRWLGVFSWVEEREFSTGLATREAAGEEERFIAQKTREAGERGN